MFILSQEQDDFTIHTFKIIGATIMIIKYLVSIWVVVLILLLLSSKAVAQHEVTGVVTEAGTGATLPGVNVVIKGTSQGTTTDLDGVYSISVPSSDEVLVFSYIGYQSREIAIDGRVEINIILAQDIFLVDELVVVGYGVQRSRDVTGSITRLRIDDMNQGFSTSVDEMLQGKAPGVQVVQNSGEPGGGMSINIRGVNSVNAGSSPLYVIDGLPIDNSVPISETGNQVAASRSPRNPLSALNPGDIESIEILKDASATAIYGARGANGVILVTTKRGHSGDLQVEYSSRFGIQNVHNKLNLLNAEQYMEGINAIIDAGAGDPSERVERIFNNGTDWQDVIFNKNAPIQNHNLSFSWGNESTSYFAALNNTMQEGIVRNSSFERYGARFNLNHTTAKFSVGIRSSVNYTKDIFVPNGFDVNLRGGAINAAKLWDPTLPVRYEDVSDPSLLPRRGDAPGDFVTTDMFDIDNPEAILTGNHMDGNRYRYFGTAFMEYNILPQLAIKVNAGGDFNNEDKTIYKDRTTIIGNSLGGVATAYEAMQSNYLIEGTVSFQEKFENHGINAVIGVTTQKFNRMTSNIQGSEFVTDATKAWNFSLANRETITTNSSKSSYQLLSYLGRVNYSFLERYLLTATYRIDGSSRFGSGNKFGYFPSISVGWLINEEDFFNSMSDAVSMLKIRTSWGQTGNQEIGNNQYLPSFSSGNRTSYIINNSFVNSLNPTRLANPELKWETTEQYNIGIDFSLFQDRISGAFEWYRKITSDMLLNLPVPSSTGFNSQLVNIGSMENTGIEFSLTSFNVTRTNVSWKTNINFSTLNNKVTDLGGIDQIFIGSLGAVAGNTNIIASGLPIWTFYGYRVTGIWQEGDDFSTVSNDNRPGDFKFLDVNSDGVINANDRVNLGNSFPDYTWEIGNTVTYKNWNLYFSFQGVQGVKMLNASLLESYFPRSGTRVNRFASSFLNRWTPDNPTNNEPSFVDLGRQFSQGVNSKTVQDASYIKLQTVRISFNFPSRWLSGLANSGEIYLSGQNLFTITDYDGFDPAINPQGNANLRIDWNAYPSATTYILGLNLRF